MSYKTKRFLKSVANVLIILAISALLYAGIDAVATFYDPYDGYDVTKVSFQLGNIDTVDGVPGRFIGDDACLLSDKIYCTGIRIENETSLFYSYKVHFYAEDNTYIGYKLVEYNKNCDIPSGSMPVLKNYVGDIDSTEYKNAKALDLDGNEVAADAVVSPAYVVIVIDPVNNENDIFTKGMFGFAGAVAKARFADSMTIHTTGLQSSESSPAVSVSE